MKKLLFAISAIVFLAVSCQKEVLDNSSEKSTEYSKTVDNPLNTIIVKMDGGTRLGIDESNKPFFEEGDVVFGWDSQNKYTYECASVEEGVATFTKTSDYAPSATEGTKVNLVYYAKGYENTVFSDNRELTIDISSQNATDFAGLPLVMTASGEVDADGKCRMEFYNETSVIKVTDCTSGASSGKTFTCYGVNLFPKMTLSIDEEGKFVKSVENSPSKISNSGSYSIGTDEKISFWLATFPTPSGAQSAKLYLGFNASTGWEYKYDTKPTSITSGKVLKLEGKAFSAVYAKIGDVPYSTLKDAFGDANVMTQPCTVKLIRNWTNSSQEIKVTNTEGVTLDLDGKTLTIKAANRITPDGGKLIIDGEGTITNTTTGSYIFSYSSGTLVLNSGEISFVEETTTATAHSYPVYVSGSGCFEMNGGTVNNGTVNVTSLRINGENAKVTIGKSDGTSNPVIKADGITSTTYPVVDLGSGELTLNKGTIGNTGSKGNYIDVRIGTGSFTMNNGTMIAQRHAIIFNGTGGSATIKNGEVRNTYGGNTYYLFRFNVAVGETGGLTIEDGYCYAHTSSTGIESPLFGVGSGTSGEIKATVSGGKFTRQPSSYGNGVTIPQTSTESQITPPETYPTGTNRKYNWQVVAGVTN